MSENEMTADDHGWQRKKARNRQNAAMWRGDLPAQAPSMLETIQRIQHFATGECEMPSATRLKCIAKECEAIIAKATGAQEATGDE